MCATHLTHPHLSSQHNLHYSPLPLLAPRDVRFVLLAGVSRVFFRTCGTRLQADPPAPLPLCCPPWLPPTLAAWVNKQCKIIQKFHGVHSDKAADKPPDRVNKGWRRVCRESK